MRIKIRLLPSRKEDRHLTLEDGACVEDAIRSLKLFPDAWIAVRDDTPLPLDEVLRDGDEIKLVSVVSGG